MDLPEEHELIWLFEQEPELMDPGLPWFYNHLTFSIERDDERLECLISPSYGDIEIHITRKGRPVLDLAFGSVSCLAVRRDSEAETLVADFGLSRVNQLRVQTKPRFHVSWGTALQGAAE